MAVTKETTMILIGAVIMAFVFITLYFATSTWLIGGVFAQNPKAELGGLFYDIEETYITRNSRDSVYTLPENTHLLYIETNNVADTEEIVFIAPGHSSTIIPDALLNLYVSQYGKAEAYKIELPGKPRGVSTGDTDGDSINDLVVVYGEESDVRASIINVWSSYATEFGMPEVSESPGIPHYSKLSRRTLPYTPLVLADTDLEAGAQQSEIVFASPYYSSESPQNFKNWGGIKLWVYDSEGTKLREEPIVEDHELTGGDTIFDKTVECDFFLLPRKVGINKPDEIIIALAEDIYKPVDEDKDIELNPFDITKVMRYYYTGDEWTMQEVDISDLAGGRLNWIETYDWDSDGEEELLFGKGYSQGGGRIHVFEEINGELVDDFANSMTFPRWPEHAMGSVRFFDADGDGEDEIVIRESFDTGTTLTSFYLDSDLTVSGYQFNTDQGVYWYEIGGTYPNPDDYAGAYGSYYASDSSSSASSQKCHDFLLADWDWNPQIDVVCDKFFEKAEDEREWLGWDPRFMNIPNAADVHMLKASDLSYIPEWVAEGVYGLEGAGIGYKFTRPPTVACPGSSDTQCACIPQKVADELDTCIGFEICGYRSSFECPAGETCIDFFPDLPMVDTCITLYTDAELDTGIYMLTDNLIPKDSLLNKAINSGCVEGENCLCIAQGSLEDIVSCADLSSIAGGLKLEIYQDSNYGATGTWSIGNGYGVFGEIIKPWRAYRLTLHLQAIEKTVRIKLTDAVELEASAS